MSLNKLLAACLAVAFVFFALATVLIWSVEANIRNPDAYIGALDRAGFFDVPYQMIREGRIPTAGGLLLTQGPLSIVTGADLETVARELAPPLWLRSQLEEAIRKLVAVTEEPEADAVPELVISLIQVKTRALGEPGDRALAYVVGLLPVCAPDRAPLDLGSNVPLCRPADLDINVFTTRLKILLIPLVARVPNSYRVEWQPEQRAVLADLRRVGRLFEQLQFGLLLLLALSLGLIGLIWLLAVRSPAEWLRWTGVPLLIVGLLALLFAWIVPNAVAWDIGSVGDMPVAVTRSLEIALQDFILLLFQPARTAGIVLAVAGLSLTLASPLFPGRQQRVLPMSSRPVR
jgi:hypothetical protein